MKKLIAVLLTFAFVVGFAACKNKTAGGGDTTTEPTGKPGDYVTDAQGVVQTTYEPYLIPDKNNEPQTTVIIKGDGSSEVAPVTTLVYAPLTYPPAKGETLAPTTIVPTSPPGNTIVSKGDSWPAYAYMNKIPKFADKVDRVDYSDKDNKHATVIWINECTFEDFASYVAKLEAAGFKAQNGLKLPEKAVEGEAYNFYSAANGIYVSAIYNTDTAAYRNCDFWITVTDYDPLA